MLFASVCAIYLLCEVVVISSDKIKQFSAFYQVLIAFNPIFNPYQQIKKKFKLVLRLKNGLKSLS